MTDDHVLTDDYVLTDDHVWLMIMSELILSQNSFDNNVYIDDDNNTESSLCEEKQELAQNNVNWDNDDNGMLFLFCYYVYFVQCVFNESLRSMKHLEILQP